MDLSQPQRVRVIDSHTAGEPTRVVIDGGPELGDGSMAERRDVFRRQHDALRRAVVNEPRGSDALVGALLCEPVDSACSAGAIFFNNVGYLDMCGHATIGLIVTLAHLGRISPGQHRIETPAGVVTTWLHDSGEVTFRNVRAYRAVADVALSVPGLGTVSTVSGDVAWGGNWFFLTADHGQELAAENVNQLTHCAWKIRHALARHGVTGNDGREIDHIELFGPAERDDADAKNFVLCPGGAYDRSPCGTGTSAKMACLFADGHLKEGQVWRQESFIGSLFTGHVEVIDGEVFPHITASAYVNAEATLILDPQDPLCMGIH
ncbi:MAG: proline racemase family protein [Candidatus Nealsonbacteria bacterium]|nr:proline racemase family protein [Candidatus Nealsonbacteria bacterium]